MSETQFDALLVDLDGVVTRTAAVHAEVWKRMFDEYLRKRAAPEEDFEPFRIERDYRQYVDGKPRYEGVKSFLASRSIDLPFGDPDDAPSRETVCGLGNRKNELFHRLLEENGVEVFQESVKQLRRWREEGYKVVVVTSSRNCGPVLKAAGLTDAFDAHVDGVVARQLGLKGKPAPDIFLEAARRLGVKPERSVVVEDSEAGVSAGRAGNFGLVVGVNREGKAHALRERGADVVVEDLSQLAPRLKSTGRSRSAKETPHLLAHRDALAARLARRRPAFFLDYDGTLTPIVSRPADAKLSSDMRATLRRLAERCFVAVVSGRDLGDVRGFVQLDQLVYAGSHGFDIKGPDGLRMQNDEAQECLSDLDEAQGALEGALASCGGVEVERKRFAIAVHYRNLADPREVKDVERVVDEVQSTHRRLRKRGGKKIFELQPAIDWDKGRAVLWLIERLGLEGEDVTPVYVGDDVTDEDAFRRLAGRGIGVFVGDSAQSTAADYRLRDPREVREFLDAMATLPDSAENAE